jgi:hypothetical protein
MAKKKAPAKPTPSAKAAKAAKSAKAAPSRGKRPVSVKKIVAEINRTLAKLEPVKAAAQARGADPQSYAIDRAMMSLRGARDVVEGICVPGFDIPF